jgi:hypothetical protein
LWEAYGRTLHQVAMGLKDVHHPELNKNPRKLLILRYLRFLPSLPRWIEHSGRCQTLDLLRDFGIKPACALSRIPELELIIRNRRREPISQSYERS